jgi:hypothetical protein
MDDMGITVDLTALGDLEDLKDLEDRSLVDCGTWGLINAKG